jgi:pimeloyl-ACP methyl ester carboxylesterase
MTMALRECLYNGRRFDIGYDIVNPDRKRSILFLHGWGSDRDIMRNCFGTLLPDMKHIYVDMPGFGRSPNGEFLTTDDYAGIVTQFMSDISTTPDIVVGHSFGGKVATLMNPPCIVLLSSAGVRVPKPLSVRVKISLYRLFKPLGGSFLRKLFVSSDAKGMNDGMYETFKYTVNEDFEEKFSLLNGKCLLYWGREDTATPLWTAERIKERVDGAKLFVLDGGHYFFLEHAGEIASGIESSCIGRERGGEI